MKRQIALSMAALLVLGAFSEAMALDGWRDRTGLLYGAHFGGGSAKSDADGAKARLGYNVGARVGGGVTEKLTLDASMNYRADDKDSVETSSLSLSLGGNFFLAEGFFVRAGAGLVNFSSSGAGSEDQTGMGFGAGMGYEFFANADLAVGVAGNFDYQTFDDFNLQVFTINVTSTLY